jgi:hypothetical protein
MLIIIFILIFSILVALGAKNLGYSGLLWWFASFIGGAFTLGLIALLPDRNLENRRAVMLDWLRREMETASGGPGPGEDRLDTEATTRGDSRQVW